MRTSTRHSASPSRRIGAMVSLVVVAVALGSVATPAWASTAPPVAAVTPVDLPPGPKPVTKDVMGAPDASNLILSDKLLLQEEQDKGTPSQESIDTAYTVGTAVPGATTIVSGAARGSLVDLHKNYPTASGRFGDNKAERVLALHYGDLGTNAVLALSSPTATLEEQSAGAPLTGQPVAGSTIQFRHCENTSGCSPSWVLTATADQSRGDLSYDYDDDVDEQNAGLPASHWYVRTPVAGDTSTYQFVNGLTGQCLSADGEDVGTGGCSLSSEAVDPSQLWQIASGGVLKSLGSSGGYLALAGGSTNPSFELSSDTGTLFSLRPIEQAGGVLPTFSVPFPSRDASLPSDLATGDLDRAVDADEHYADEAAVAYVDENRALHLTVIDYNGPNGVVTTDTTIAEGSTDYGTVAVEIADFDGDTDNEIAVVYQNADGSAQVEFVAYRSPGTTELLTTSKAPVFAVGQNAQTIETFAVASGDFTGGGGAELSMSYQPGGSRSPVVEIASFDATFAVASSTRQTISSDNTLYDITQVSGCETEDVGSWCSHAHRLEPALLEVPLGSDDFARRQLVFGWTMAQVDDNEFGSGYNMTPYTCYAALSVDQGADNTSLTSKVMGTTCDQVDPTGIVDSFAPELPKKHREPIQLAPGAYNGRDATSDALPVWSVATLRDTPGSNLTIRTWNSTTQSWDSHSVAAGSQTNQGTLTAYDQNDTSLRLGAPLVVRLNSDESPTVIAAAPPAHVDWIWDTTNQRADFVNLTSFPDTNLTMAATATSNFDSATTDETSTSSGQSVSASVRQTVKEDALVVSSKQTVELTGVLSHANVRAKQNTAGDSYSTETSSSSTSVNDDLLRVKSISRTIFRYPILGGGTASPAGDTPCADACFSYFDVNVPSSTETVQAEVGGKSVDWYQPTWLNGNALSYPTTIQEAPGTYTYTDDQKKKITATGFLAQQASVFGETVSSSALAITASHATNFVSSSLNTIGGSLEVKGSVKVTENLGVEAAQFRYSGDVSVDASKVFGGTDTGSTTTSSDSSLRVGLTNTSVGQYGIDSSYYYDKAGVVKVTHTVDLEAGNDMDWWMRTYGETPDPALSLPNDINIDSDAKLINQVPRFTAGFKRQEIRGFAALQASDTGNPADGVEYATTPKTGDQVTFAVPVHNYSLIQARDTTVEFFAVPVDPNTGDRVGPPEQIGGAKTISELDPRGIVTAYSDPWTAVGPAAAGAQRTWRIFVVLNRTADPASETHSYRAAPAGTPLSNNTACPTTSNNDSFERAAPGETDPVGGFLIDPMTGAIDQTACGGNNQGYGELTVQGTSSNTLSARSASSPDAVAVADAAVAVTAEPNVRLAGAGFRTENQAISTLTETSPVPSLEEGVPVSGVVTVDADADSSAHQRVLIYDGLPDHGGRLIASTTLRGAAANEPGYAKYTWTPHTVGRHQLYQKLLTEDGAGQTDAQIVTVDVTPQQTELIPVPAADEPSPTATAAPTVPLTPQPSSTSSASSPDGGLANTGLALSAVIAVAMLALGSGVVLAASARRRRNALRRQG